MKIWIALLAALVCTQCGHVPLAFAQDINAANQTAFGYLTTAGTGTDCSVQQSCVYIVAPYSAASATVQLSGTWVATVQIEQSVSGSVWTNVSTQSGNGIYAVTLSGARFLRARASAYTSGSARVDIGVSSGGGGSGGSGTATALGVSANAVKAQSATLANQVFAWVPGNSDFELVVLAPIVSGQGTAKNANGSNQEIDVVRNIRTVSGTSDTPTVADCGGQIEYTNTGAVTIALPQANNPAGTFQEGCEIKFIAQGAAGVSGGLTINTTTSNIYNYNGTTGGTATQTTVAALSDINLNSHGGNWWNTKQPIATTLDAIGNPAAAKTFTMGTNALGFTFGAATGAGNMISVTDNASNTGTGYLIDAEIGSSSGAAPFKFCGNGGNCVWGDHYGNVHANATFFGTFFAGLSNGVYGNENVTFSATPTFSNTIQTSYITMTGNITSFTLAGGQDGQLKTLDFIQDGSGSHTVAAPANVHGLSAVGTTASKHNVQTFVFIAGSINLWLATAAMSTNQ